MMWKNFRKIIQKLLVVCYMLRKLKKAQFKPLKSNHSVNDSKRTRMSLSCSTKIICIIKGNDGDFYCLNSPHSFRSKIKFELHKKVCENKDFCSVLIPSEITRTLEFTQYWKFDKTPSTDTIYLEF